jgi:hypothetical protein
LLKQKKNKNTKKNQTKIPKKMRTKKILPRFRKTKGKFSIKHFLRKLRKRKGGTIKTYESFKTNDNNNESNKIIAESNNTNSNHSFAKSKKTKSNNKKSWWKRVLSWFYKENKSDVKSEEIEQMANRLSQGSSVDNATENLSVPKEEKNKIKRFLKQFRSYFSPKTKKSRSRFEDDSEEPPFKELYHNLLLK